MAKQKKLKTTPDNETSLNDYELSFIPTPVSGPIESDPIFDEYFGFEFFTQKRLHEYHAAFAKLILDRGVPLEVVMKIENCLKAFVDSSTKKKELLAILLKSIEVYRPGILTEKFELSEEDVKQVIGKKYFDDLSWVHEMELPDESLIPSKHLATYKKCAEDITIRGLEDWTSYLLDRDGDAAWALSLDDIPFYRGINNGKYYQEKKTKAGRKKAKHENQGNFLSVYTGVSDGSSDFPYFEKKLLSSYTISSVLAEQFMVGFPSNASERRVIVEGYFDMLEGRIFSSFINSPNFAEGQFEILCFPDTEHLNIQVMYDLDICSGFMIKSQIK